MILFIVVFLRSMCAHDDKAPAPEGKPARGASPCGVRMPASVAVGVGGVATLARAVAEAMVVGGRIEAGMMPALAVGDGGGAGDDGGGGSRADDLAMPGYFSLRAVGRPLGG